MGLFDPEATFVYSQIHSCAGSWRAARNVGPCSYVHSNSCNAQAGQDVNKLLLPPLQPVASVGLSAGTGSKPSHRATASC